MKLEGWPWHILNFLFFLCEHVNDLWTAFDLRDLWVVVSILSNCPLKDLPNSSWYKRSHRLENARWKPFTTRLITHYHVDIQSLLFNWIRKWHTGVSTGHGYKHLHLTKDKVRILQVVIWVTIYWQSQLRRLCLLNGVQSFKWIGSACPSSY